MSFQSRSPLAAMTVSGNFCALAFVRSLVPK